MKERIRRIAYTFVLLLAVISTARCKALSPNDSPAPSSTSTQGVLDRHAIAVCECTVLIRPLYEPSDRVDFMNWTDSGEVVDKNSPSATYWVYTVDVASNLRKTTTSHSCTLFKGGDGSFWTKLTESFEVISP
ncbi:hypothetical protein L5G32_09005 [Gordonia sp. HY002]|uniref:hypothetical protein n=1 Tax=Gordonia zhenghanii TaxID=2911516 RepID=UPI001EF00A9E|nr:hypothetical protein [Gordonia zhenghanii]MCF8570402.1 hypothetical protein [Gordonia zhenghanii]MCF8604632.1 hypothetical protein [Gordonia zhenghanii]